MTENLSANPNPNLIKHDLEKESALQGNDEIQINNGHQLPGVRSFHIVQPLKEALSSEEKSPKLVETVQDLEEAVLEFDGKDDYVDCGIAECFNLSQALTIEVWIKLREVKPGTRYYIVGRGSRQYNYSYGLLYLKLKSHQEQIRFLFAKEPVVWEPTINLSDRHYHHLALVIDNQQAILYLDGKSQGKQPLSEQLYPNTEVPLQMGRLFGQTRLHGEMSEVRLWSAVRTSKEIRKHRFHRLAGDEPGLVGYWPLNDGSGDLGGDRTSNSNPGQIYGATWKLSPSSQLPFVPTSSSQAKPKKSKSKSQRQTKIKVPKGIDRIILLRSKDKFGGKPDFLYEKSSKTKDKNKKRKKNRKKKNGWLQDWYRNWGKALSKI